jgi:hypothetical protein
VVEQWDERETVTLNKIKPRVMTSLLWVGTVTPFKRLTPNLESFPRPNDVQPQTMSRSTEGEENRFYKLRDEIESQTLLETYAGKKVRLA